MTATVARHRTALVRTALSRPLAVALADGLLDPSQAIFDYGCGRGDDLRHLTDLGFTADGWDPTHRPAARRAADVVNLGYVVNVIEDQAERTEALRAAWSLTQRLLVVAARLVWDARDLAGQPFGDGIVTANGTFQKFYEQSELAAWIEQTLAAQPLAAAPGIFYVFRNSADAQDFLARRVRTYRPRVHVDPHSVYDAHRELLTPLLEFLTQHARPPRPGELPTDLEASIRSEVGSLTRAVRLIRTVTEGSLWEEVETHRRAELLIYIALSRFGRRPRFGELDDSLAWDIKALFGSYLTACVQADRLLFATGNRDLIYVATRTSQVGKLSPTALYVHRSALQQLPPPLRVYEGCARVLAGTVEGANLIKLSVAEPQVSYLTYPGFDRDAHPALAGAVTVHLRRLTVDYRDYTRSTNPPVLHRKEEFVSTDYPRRKLFARLTRAEQRAALYERPERIGTREGWMATLAERGFAVNGHRLARNASSSVPLSQDS